MSRRVFIDYSRSACLCESGLAGATAAACVDEDGHVTFALVVDKRLGDDRYAYDPTTPEAPHEQDGPLPAQYIERIAASRRTYRCGRRTKSGAPCRRPVGRAGDACGWHGR